VTSPYSQLGQSFRRQPVLRVRVVRQACGTGQSRVLTQEVETSRPPAFPVEQKTRIVLSILAGEITVAEAARQYNRTVSNHIRPYEVLGYHRPIEVLADPLLHPIHKNQSGDLVPKS
jgi:hypothetical protein